MITLEAADLIEGDASAANVVDYTINGAQVDSSRNVDVKALADGQLAGSKATLYTTPASTTAIVKSITLVNTDSSARTVNLYVQRDGTNSRRIIPENLTLEANGGSVVVSDAIYVYSASGELLQKYSGTHADQHTTGGADEVDGDKLDIDWNPTNYTPTTTPSEADNVDNLTAHLYGIDQELGQKLENVVEDVTPQLGGDLDCQSNKFTNMLGFLMKAATELTIASGAVTVTQMFHTVDTEGDAATDDLDTINGGTTVNLIILRAENDARTVVVKHNTGNIWLQGKADINLDDLEDGIMLVWDSTNSKWFDIAAGGGGGGGSSTWLGLTDTPSSFSGKAGQVPKVNSGESALEFITRGWELIDDHYFSSSATTYTISNLDGDNDGLYLIYFYVHNDYDGSPSYYLRPNNDSGANYPYQRLTATGATVAGLSGTVTGWFIGGIGELDAEGWNFAFIYPKSGVKRMAWQLRGDERPYILIYYSWWTNTVDNITSIVLAATNTDAIGVGSRVMVFKKG